MNEYTFKIGFSKSTKKFAIGSLLIRLFQKSNFSHTYISFKHPLIDSETIFQATGSGVNYISRPRFELHNVTVKEFEISIDLETFKSVLQKCHDTSGIKYGFMQNLGIALNRWMNKLGLKVNVNLFNKGVNCSELVAEVISVTSPNLIIRLNKDINLVTPLDIFNYLNGGING